MTEIPTAWLWVTGIFAGMSIIVMIFQAVLIAALVNLIKDLQPKLATISGKVHGIADKVEGIADQVEGIADSAKGIADTAKGTVESIGGKARSVATTSAHKIEEKMDTATPIFVYAKMAIDLVGAFLEMRERKTRQAARNMQ